MQTPIPAPPSETAASIDPSTAFSGAIQLAHLGLIRVTGEDAAGFLQGQLTQDVASVGLLEARLAAFCNAKGRMQASFVVFKRSEAELLLICSQDILSQTLKRLSMFVMRARAKLSDASAEFGLWGVVGGAIETIAGRAGTAWAKADIDAAHMIFLPPAAGLARGLWCAPIATIASATPPCQTLDAGVWEWLEVQSGIAMITLPIFEAFVPQMLNYESTGGVNFKKGCYPGQEIVARSQFRGTLKRRAYLVHVDAEAQVGDEVFHVSDASQPCGMVAASAASPLGGFDAIVSMQTFAAAEPRNNALTLKQPSGPALVLLPLPYPLLEDI